MPKSCSVPNCTTASGDRRSFYKFPLHDPERLDLWLRNMGRSNWTPTRHQYICHQHFAPSNFKICSGVCYLKNTAVPTLFQKEKVVRANKRISKWRQRNQSQSIKRLGSVKEGGNCLQSELCDLGQIWEFKDQGPSQPDTESATSKDQQMTILQTIDHFSLCRDGTEMILITEDQGAHDSSTSWQTGIQALDMEDSTCTLIDLSNICEVTQTPDNAYFEVIPSLRPSQTPQLIFVPETILTSALSGQPITSTIPIVSKHDQGSKVEESPDKQEEEEDDVDQDNGSFVHQQQEEHCYHKHSMSKEQLEAIVVDLQQKVKILQQRHNRDLDKLEELEKTVAQLRQSNLLYEERLQLLERANFRANLAVSDHGEIVTIIYGEEDSEYFSTNIP